MLPGLLGLLILTPMSTSANAVYQSQFVPYRALAPNAAPSAAPDAVQPQFLTDAAVQAFFQADIGNQAHRYLAMYTPLAETRPATAHMSQARQAGATLPGDCDSTTGLAPCDMLARTSPSPRQETSYLPEPSPWFMLLLGLVGIVLLRREP